MCWCFMFCFCKQKTAYEMRISDWSSDVCSSDLADPHQWWRKGPDIGYGALEYGKQPCRGASPARRMVCQRVGRPLSSARNQISRPLWRGPIPSFGRSEEHTSELQSLMRISYAVFCLKKKRLRHEQSTIHATTNTHITT